MPFFEFLLKSQGSLRSTVTWVRLLYWGKGTFYHVILNVCISGLHLVHGKLAAIVVQPQAIQNLAIPDAAIHVRAILGPR
jgi:hypothetical protein